MLALYSWLNEIHRLYAARDHDDTGPGSRLSQQLVIILDAGRTSREQGNSVIKEAISTACVFWETPFKLTSSSGLQANQGTAGGGQRPPVTAYLSALVASGAEAELWIAKGSFRAFVASLFPFSAATIARTQQGSDSTDAGHIDPPPNLASGPSHQLPGSGQASLVSVAASELEEAKVSADCQAQLGLVKSFESTHGLDLPSMPDAFIEQRSLLVSRILEVRPPSLSPCAMPLFLVSMTMIMIMMMMPSLHL